MMNALKRLLLLLNLSLASWLLGQSSGIQDYRTYGLWSSSAISGGGYIINVVPSLISSSRLYAYSDVGGAFRSDDNGSTWTMIHGGLPGVPGAGCTRGLIVDPRDDDRLLILVGNWVTTTSDLGVFVSTDAGETWQKTLDVDTNGNSVERAGGFVLVRDPNDADHVLVAADGDGLFESTDNGMTWTYRGLNGIQPVHVLIDRTDSSRWWVCAKDFENWQQQLAGGLYFTEDGGVTWTLLQNSINTPTEFLQDPSDPSHLVGICQENRLLCYSRNQGREWQPLSDGLLTDLQSETLPSSSVYLYRALSAGPNFLLTVNSFGNVFRLEAGQTVWSEVVPQMDVQKDISWWGGAYSKFGLAAASITVNPHDPDNWYLTDFLSIFQTLDAGAHWYRSTEGVENTVVLGVTQDPSNPNRVHAALADIGYLRSEDAGELFHVMEGLGYPRNTTMDRNVKTIALSRVNTDRVYATAERDEHWQVNQLYISDDGGVVWNASSMTGLPLDNEHECNTVAVHPDDPDMVFLGVAGPVVTGGGGVYRSSDGGSSWEWIGEGLPSNQAFFGSSVFLPGPDLAVSPDGSMVCFTVKGRALYYYDAALQIWSIASLNWAEPAELRSVVADVHHPGRFYAGIYGKGLYRSNDGGKTWGLMNVPSASAIAVDMVKPGRLAMAVDGGVLYSEDDALTWTFLDDQLPIRDYRSTIAFAGDRLVVGTRGSGIFWIPVPEKPWVISLSYFDHKQIPIMK